MPGEPFALFIEDHDGDAGKGLGHGVRAEDSVLGHRYTLFRVPLAGSFRKPGLRRSPAPSQPLWRRRLSDACRAEYPNCERACIGLHNPDTSGITV